jgi:polyisoprenoid-binding protein YceI
MYYKHLLTLLIVAGCCSSCKQNQTSVAPEKLTPATKNFVSAYGPTRMVRSVKQAKNGDMLIVSFTGVWRYDTRLAARTALEGKDSAGQLPLFTNITSGINSPSFWDVLEDKKGNLWFSSKDSGVYYYDGASFLHYTTRQGLAHNAALTMLEDKDGHIWFGTVGGVSRFDGKSFRNFTTKDGLPNNSINTIMEDKTGRIWFGTRGDASFYDGKKFTVLRNEKGEAFHNVWGIAEDAKGHIWLGGSIVKSKKASTYYLESGLWRYDGSTITKVSDLAASAITIDRKGNIWTTGAVNSVGITYWSVNRYDGASLYSDKPAVTEIMSVNKMLCRIVEAKDGSIWFGSGKGVYRWDGKAITNFTPLPEQIYTIDEKKSVITWKGSMKLSPEDKHVGYVSVSNAALWVDKNQLVGGDIQIEMNSLEYADKLDKNTPIHHLKSPDYFDVRKFPTASLGILKVDAVDANTFHITANLTIKAVTQQISFPATIQIQQGVLTASAQLTIDRTHWGINYRSGKFYKKFADQIVSDDIEFLIQIVAKR